MRGDLQELERAFAEFERLPLPEDSEDDDAGELHAELAEYDSYVAGLITTLLAGNPVPPDSLQFDEDLKARLEALAREGREPASSDAQKYLRYLEALREILALARAATAA